MPRPGERRRGLKQVSKSRDRQGLRIDTDRVEGRDPPLAVGDIEDDGCRDGRHEPGILLDLDFELARVPARVSQDQRDASFSRNECREGFSAPGDGQTFRKNQVIVLQRAVPGFGKHETMAELRPDHQRGHQGKLGGWGMEPQLFEDVREIHIDGTVATIKPKAPPSREWAPRRTTEWRKLGITQRGHRDEEFADERIHAFMLAEGRAALDTGWGAGRSIAGLTAKAQRRRDIAFESGRGGY